MVIFNAVQGIFSGFIHAVRQNFPDDVFIGSGCFLAKIGGFIADRLESNASVRIAFPGGNKLLLCDILLFIPGNLEHLEIEGCFCQITAFKGLLSSEGDIHVPGFVHKSDIRVHFLVCFIPGNIFALKFQRGFIDNRFLGKHSSVIIRNVCYGQKCRTGFDLVVFDAVHNHKQDIFVSGCSAADITLDQVFGCIALNIGFQIVQLFLDTEIELSCTVKADICEINLRSAVCCGLNRFPEYFVIVIRAQFADDLIIFFREDISHGVTAQLFHGEIEFLSLSRILAVNLFARLDFSIEAHQGSAFIGIKVTFRVRTDKRVVADHCAAVVAGRNLDQGLGRHNVSEFAFSGALHGICQVRIIVHDGDARACFNSIKRLTVYCQFGCNHGTAGIQEVDHRSGKIRSDLFLAVNIFKDWLISANDKIDRDCITGVAFDCYIRSDVHIDD